MQPLPIAATIDLQGRLPPFQQIIFSTPVMISLILLAAAIVILVALSARARAETRRQKHEEDLRMAQTILARRGGDAEDVARITRIFEQYPKIDPSAATMMAETFHDQVHPVLERTFGAECAERLEKLLFPPIKNAAAIIAEEDSEKTGGETKAAAAAKAPAAMIDLMDSTLRPGMVLNVAFPGVEGNRECLVMNYSAGTVNITLPANNAALLNSIRPGGAVEGSFENGLSLMAFSSAIEAVVAGSMPFCRLSTWKTAWEVRKRESIRLDTSLDVDFQHISTSSSEAIKVSQLDRELGSIMPGRVCNLSLGGCCLETPLDKHYEIGDFIRFTASLIPGHPPATLLGAIVEMDAVADPAANDGMTKCIHVQFLALDDVSQRLLVKTMHHLQDVKSREEWRRAQQLAEQMRRNNIPIPENSASGGTRSVAPQAAKAPGGSTARRKSSTVRRLRPSDPSRFR